MYILVDDILKYMSILKLIRTGNENQDFRQLVEMLNAELAIIDGDDHAFYNQYNGLQDIKHVVMAYQGDTPVGCGTIKHYDTAKVEIKRMYTIKTQRAQGIASRLIVELENWAEELGYQSLILETGKRQEDAVALYTKAGYKKIDNYGPYIGVDNSVCFYKPIHDH